MSAVTSLCLARAIAAHAAASRRADAALARGPGDIDETGAAENAALERLDEVLRGIASPDDVAAVLAHAYQQGGRAAEPGAQGAVMLRLVAALARRAFGAPLMA